MSVLLAKCPACAAPVEFKSGQSIVIICNYCRSAIARTDRELKDLGKVAELVETGSPLDVGVRGTWRDVPFELTGRAQLGHEMGGQWDEWYATFSNHWLGWLAEAQGRFYLTFQYQVPENVTLPSFDQLELGQTVAGLPWPTPLMVAETGRATALGAKGEIPYLLTPGETYYYADLSGPNGTFGTLDYNQTPPLVFLGQQVTLEELGITSTRTPEREQRQVGAAHLGCPHCGGPLELRAPDKTERVTCPNCNSLLDVNQGQLKFLKALEKSGFQPLIPIGTAGDVSEQKLAKKYTDNNEAYQLYLQGRFHLAKRTKEDLLKGIEYFQQAIKLDPNFALAYAGIAESYHVMPSFAYLSPKEAFPQAKAAATRALEIDPNISEAHTALGTYFATYDWNWAEAEREYKRAIELSPNSSIAHFRYGQYLATVGRSDESIAEMKRAVELEPLSLIIGANLAATYLFAGQNEKGLEQAMKIYDLEPNFVGGRFWLGIAYNTNGMYKEAITISEKILQTDPNNQVMLFVAGYAYAKSGSRQEAEEIVKRFREIEKTQYVLSSFIASIYGALGEKEKAFAELEKAVETRDSELCRLKVAPYWDPLRDDPQFKELVKRVRIPE